MSGEERKMQEGQTRELLSWYYENRRILPWREDPTPYHVWLSEIMLQQTRVEAGKAYYLRFLETLPDIASLAAAPEDVYLKLWEGLGYYSRVRNLHKAAVQIMEDYGGRMPEDPKELEKLPGIGPYSAAAIASIAFQKPVVSVDGNLLRVFARMTRYSGDIKAMAARKTAMAYYETGLSEAGSRPGDFNQALMDLGAGTCLPNGEPLCGQCPWKERCLSHGNGTELSYPVVPEKKERKKEKRTVFLIHRKEKIAIRRRPEEGLLAGLYEFPEVPGHLKPEEVISALEEMGFSRECLGDVSSFQKLPVAKHIFSHVEWAMTGYEIFLVKENSGQENVFFASLQELQETYSIPSAFEKYKKHLGIS